MHRRRTLQNLAWLIIFSYTIATFIIIYQSKDCKNELKEYNLPKIKTIKPIEEVYSEYKEKVKLDGLQLANLYVGMRGDCYRVSIKFVEELKGIKVKELKPITEKELICGDLIFYKNSGIGTTHWGVYLDEGIALQPNTKGKAVIGKVYYSNMSVPKFYRAIGERKTK